MALDCVKCPSLCCRMAGYVEVSRADIRRLARHLGLTVRAFEAKHIVERTRKGSKRIKTGHGVCQFLREDRMCGVYEARPRDCRGYVCWNQQDDTVFQFARFFQTSPEELRRAENADREGHDGERHAPDGSQAGRPQPGRPDGPSRRDRPHRRRAA
ncbi:MAG: YkgJ family cysteine cluster protein [Acetobacteraceae bacterium]